MSRAAASISVSFHVLSCRRPLFLVRALTPPGLRGSQPVVKVQLHSAGDASPRHPTAHSPRRGGPGLTALLLPQIFPIFSVVVPCQPSASPSSVRRWTFTTDSSRRYAAGISDACAESPTLEQCDISCCQ